jgi:hypothetical protein
MAMEATEQLTTVQNTESTLPIELWLQILEYTTISKAEHLWMSVRQTSRQFRDCVERLFESSYLSQFAISLSLPLRDTSGMRPKCWPGAIPGAQMIMTFDGTTPEGYFAIFLSPLELIKHGEDRVSVEDLRSSGVLPETRLLEATAWVYPSKNYMAGRPLQISSNIEWDEASKRWIWLVEWRKLVSRFYVARIEARAAQAKHNSCHAKRRSGRAGPL